MAERNKQPRIVAELGRPETPEEQVARKAENRRVRRQNQTLFNLVLATLASLVVALFVGLLLSNSGSGEVREVDYRAAARDAQPGVQVPLAVPSLPEGWRANSAELATGSDGIQTWTIGFVTPDDQYIALVQGIDANATWLADAVDRAASTGTVQVDASWTVYDRRSQSDTGNYAYALSTSREGSTFVLHGTATTTEFQTLARATLFSADGGTGANS